MKTVRKLSTIGLMTRQDERLFVMRTIDQLSREGYNHRKFCGLTNKCQSRTVGRSPAQGQYPIVWWGEPSSTAARKSAMLFLISISLPILAIISAMNVVVGQGVVSDQVLLISLNFTNQSEISLAGCVSNILLSWSRVKAAQAVYDFANIFWLRERLDDFTVTNW